MPSHKSITEILRIALMAYIEESGGHLFAGRRYRLARLVWWAVIQKADITGKPHWQNLCFPKAGHGTLQHSLLSSVRQQFYVQVRKPAAVRRSGGCRSSFRPKMQYYPEESCRQQPYPGHAPVSRNKISGKYVPYLIYGFEVELKESVEDIDPRLRRVMYMSSTWGKNEINV